MTSNNGSVNTPEGFFFPGSFSKFPNLSPKHYKEFEASGIHPSLIKHNLKSRDDDWVFEFLAETRLENLGKGKQTPHSYQYFTSGVINLRNKYGKLAGWVFQGMDIFGKSEMTWGCVKPDNPRIDISKGKPIKYEHPAGVSTRAFIPKVSYIVGQIVADKHGFGHEYCERYNQAQESEIDWDFWDWIRKKKILITITEGSKKALSLVSHGYPAIGLPGIFSGAKNLKDDDGKIIETNLLPELQYFAENPLAILFDYDEKEKTRQAVEYAIDRQSRELIRKGNRKVYRIPFKGPEKGIDDFIVAHGSDALDALYKDKCSYVCQVYRNALSLGYPTIKVCKEKLGSIDFLSSGFQFIKSAKGTGKTEALISLVRESQQHGRTVLLITHRISLGRGACLRLGMEWIEDFKKHPDWALLNSLWGYGLCMDSLHPTSQAKFNPSDWGNCILILDEIEQILLHLLTSSTLKEHQTSIMESFKQLLKNIIREGGLIIGLDADLSSLSIDFIRELCEISKEDFNPRILENTWKGSHRKVLFLKDCKSQSVIYQEIMRAICNGERISICLDSRNEGAKYSSFNLEKMIKCFSEDIPTQFAFFAFPLLIQKDLHKMALLLMQNHLIENENEEIESDNGNIEALIKDRFPNKKICRIDSQTIGETGHFCKGATDDINSFIETERPDVLIYTPTMGTGVSVDIKGYFSKVFGIFNGVINPTDSLQMMHRIRDVDCEWIIWSREFGLGKFEGKQYLDWMLYSGKTNTIKQRLSFVNSENCRDFALDGKLDDIYLWYWGKFAARYNAGSCSFQESLLHLLKKEGHDIYHFISSSDESLEIIDEFAEMIRDKSVTDEAFAISKADISEMDNEKFRSLKNQRAKSPTERRKERKYQLNTFYGGVPIDADLVLKDNQGWGRKIRTHYFLENPNRAIDSDVKKLEKVEETGQVFLPTLKLYSHDIALLRDKLQVLKFLNPDEVFSKNHPLVREVFDFCLENRLAIYNFLGISIDPKKGGIALVQSILNLIGLKLTPQGQKRRPVFSVHGQLILNDKGKPKSEIVREYRFLGVDDRRGEIFSQWDIAAKAFSEEGESVTLRTYIDIDQGNEKKSAVLSVTDFDQVQTPDIPLIGEGTSVTLKTYIDIDRDREKQPDSLSVTEFPPDTKPIAMSSDEKDLIDLLKSSITIGSREGIIAIRNILKQCCEEGKASRAIWQALSPLEQEALKLAISG